MEKIGSQHFVEEEKEDSFRLNPSISAWLCGYPTLRHNSIPEWSQGILCKVPTLVMRRWKLLLFCSVTFTSFGTFGGQTGLWTRMSISVSSAFDCSVLGWRCPQLQHCCQIQHFITNQKIVILDKFLVVYNMLDLATILQLQTAPPQNTAVKAELTKIANCELRN